MNRAACGFLVLALLVGCSDTRLFTGFAVGTDGVWIRPQLIGHTHGVNVSISP